MPLATVAKRALRGVRLGFIVEIRRAWLERQPNSVPRVDRSAVAQRQLRGEGLEIGALHAPIPVANGVVVRFVDLFSKGDNVLRFPDLPPEQIVEPDFLEDGFELSSIPGDSQDFVIASHVLEHSPDPIQVLVNWSRVTRAGGLLYIIVPIAEGCFDAGREQTTLEHLIEDYELSLRGETARMRERNRHHYYEWIAISEQHIFRDQGHDFDRPTEEAIDMRIRDLLDGDVEIHFHTFTSASFRKLLEHFCEVRRPGSQVVEFHESANEVLGVVKLG